MVVFWQKWLYSGKCVCIRVIWLYSGKEFFYKGNVVVFWAKLVEIVQMWLYSGKSRCIREEVVVFGKFGCIPAKWLCLGKVVVF